jgi:hypothetical protein
MRKTIVVGAIALALLGVYFGVFRSYVIELKTREGRDISVDYCIFSSVIYEGKKSRVKPTVDKNYRQKVSISIYLGLYPVAIPIHTIY